MMYNIDIPTTRYFIYLAFLLLFFFMHVLYIPNIVEKYSMNKY